jgi:hypothetical protein
MGERRRRLPWSTQLRALAPLVPAWLVAILVLGVISMGNRRFVEDVLLDANDRSGVQWYVGIVTFLDVLCWAAAAVSAAWGAWLAGLDGRRGARRFLGAAVVLTSWVMLDDLFQLHSIVLPRATGVDKYGWEGLIVVATVTWAWCSRREIVRTRVAVLAAALMALATSLWADRFGIWASPRLALLFEDGAKLLGAAAWATYFVVTTRDVTRSVLSARGAGPDDVERGARPEPGDVLVAHGVHGLELDRGPIGLRDHAVDR